MDRKKTRHKEALAAILEQFKGYSSNCSGCDKTCPDCGNPDICDDNDLICEEKLKEAAEELDA